MTNSWTIGSGPDCDLVVDLPTVSRLHCRLRREGDGFLVEDLGSSNGTYVNGERIAAPVRVSRGDSVTLGASVPMPWPPEPASRGPKALTIGREPDNDVVVNFPTVSGHHARIVWEGQSGVAWIEDLGSSNSTALGSPERRITRSALTADDTIYLGTHPIAAASLLAKLQPEHAPTLIFRGQQEVIGRDPGCDRVLDLPMISGRHARLSRSNGRILIEDLASSNGTFVNGRRIDRPVVVEPGDSIGLGSYTLVLSEGSSTEAASESLEEFLPVDEPPPGPADRPGGFRSVLEHPLGLAALLIQAPLIALLIAVASGGVRAPAPPEVASKAVGATLSWLSLSALWFGLSNALLGNVLETSRRGGHRGPRGATPLILRLVVLGALCGLQCVLAWAIVSNAAGLKGPAAPALAFLITASAVGLALGLALVQVVPRPALALAILPLAMVAFWLFGGERRPLPAMASWARVVANALPARWAFEGLLLVESDRNAAGGEGRRDLAEAFFPADSERMGERADMIALGAMLVGLVASAAFLSEDAKPSPGP